ncbi:MAG: MotA/TolQ/ExbB proton channel family protein [Pirellulaceae bacterium]|jgi:biopolymer transport protein ExbB/TolQ|nr:MotA/TolQ/ExbB proton channel family protein [Pirellulaceae bacterium]MDP6554767.1 MotA/TolQ/ExbB proton channel family protein [Pirellulaceae bacterium]
MAELTKIVGVIVYVFMGSMALWGAFCCVMVWARVAQKRFKNEKIQDEFLDTVDEPLSKGDFDDATVLCEGDPRAIPQLAMLAVLNRSIGFTKARQLVEDRFQRDILADLEHRLTWVHTIIKSAPMVGLFGTVTGMMGAFDKLATSENVKPDELAENISFALITTACGLAIAIPLIIAVAAVNIRIRKMEELTVAGINRFLESFQAALKMAGRKK